MPDRRNRASCTRVGGFSYRLVSVMRTIFWAALLLAASSSSVRAAAFRVPVAAVQTCRQYLAEIADLSTRGRPTRFMGWRPRGPEEIRQAEMLRPFAALEAATDSLREFARTGSWSSFGCPEFVFPIQHAGHVVTYISLESTGPTTWSPNSTTELDPGEVQSVTGLREVLPALDVVRVFWQGRGVFYVAFDGNQPAYYAEHPGWSWNVTGLASPLHSLPAVGLNVYRYADVSDSLRMVAERCARTHSPDQRKGVGCAQHGSTRGR